jgi:hypothetical protein
MKRQRLWWLLALALPVVGLNCAPVDDLPEKKAHARPAEGPADAPIPPAPGLPRELQALQQRVRAAIENVRRRDLLVSYSFWTVFHGILGLGLDAELVDPAKGTRFNAVEYIRNGGKILGMEFVPTEYGLEVPFVKQFPGQGHQDQFVAEMTQQGMPLDTKFVVNGKDFTFKDFVRQSQMEASVTRKQELSWALIVVGQNLGTDISWTNKFGEKLHFEDMVRYELNQSIDKAACGGTHRLFGLNWAYHTHLLHGGKKTDVWDQVAAHTAKYQQLAKEYQNPDGSFSTSYFAGKGNVRKDELRISTTGHILEWLALSLSDEELRQPWVQQAAGELAVMILNNRDEPIESGGLYHATHALILYHTRVMGPIEGHHVPPCPPRPQG